MVKEYDFGEKEYENIGGKKVKVEFKTPKFYEAKAKAEELLKNEKYKDTLLPSDFWILVNTYANKTKAMYSGLIISHDGCLKINDTLPEELKFKAECIEIDKQGYNNSLVFVYRCKEQKLFEVGEVNSVNCKNDYVYAMALKRCFDRVVLKNSKIAYSGIYSESESDSFKESTEEEDYRIKIIDFCKDKKIDMLEIAQKYKLNSETTQDEFRKAFEEISKGDGNNA